MEGNGWRFEILNELAVAKFGEKTTAAIAVAPETGAESTATVKLTAVSESDSSVMATKRCVVHRQ